MANNHSLNTIWCKFQPFYKRANGGRTIRRRFNRARSVPRQSYGAWVVSAIWDHCLNSRALLHFDNEVAIPSYETRRAGTRVSPIKLLREFHRQRDEAADRA